MTQPQVDRLGNLKYWFKKPEDGNYLTDSHRYAMSLGYLTYRKFACSCKGFTHEEFYAEVNPSAPMGTFCLKCKLPKVTCVVEHILRCESCSNPYVLKPIASEWPIRELRCYECRDGSELRNESGVTRSGFRFR